MAVTAATAIAGLGAAGSIMGAKGGGSEATQATPTGFESLPKEVQDVFLKTYLPAVETEFNKPYEAMPFERYQGDPASPFFNPQLDNLQRYSDQYGGLITDNGAGQQAPVDDGAAEAAQQKAMDNLRLEMIGRNASQNSRYDNGSPNGLYTAAQSQSSPMGNDDYRLLGYMREQGALSDGGGLNSEVTAGRSRASEGFASGLRDLGLGDMSRSNPYAAMANQLLGG